MLNHKALISLGLFAGVLAGSNPAFAQTRTVAVTTSDLDLSAPADQVKLEHRVLRAARAVCASDSRSARDHAAVKICEANAIAGAEPKIAQRIAQHAAQRGIAVRKDLKLASD